MNQIVEISKTEDSRARRAAARAGYKIVKSRWRQHSVDNYGRYQLVDSYNTVVYGARFELSPADVLEICKQ